MQRKWMLNANHFSVIWIFYLGIKFGVFKSREDFYSRVFNFAILSAKLKTREIKYQ